MAPDPRPGTRENPISIDDEDHKTANRQTSPDMTVFPMITEGTVGNPPHGLPLKASLDDDQRTVSTELATPPSALTEDMAEGNLHVPPPDIEWAQEHGGTDSGIPSKPINTATIDGEHTSQRSSIGISQGTDPVHPVHPVPPNGVQESTRTPRPANSIYFECTRLGSSRKFSRIYHLV
ncbi:hypothetical protein CNMCM8927_002244 [Aspergillus lentulus]|uniref:Uncharacterized protein n=1 Tax=Aspergillus lentulus TaxID=293939 RepID=A0AAN5YGS6_ASPLE|nr:hypothetical protein CNMCM8060_003892 [Aspergillus lentulus]KAF4189900.1 hypothetical protein CNMCM8694_003930 [Aspergillus lentulus]KAF4200994.1 hypothetical protein CNMCM8927_002244 [Aspergillus lentulus]